MPGRSEVETNRIRYLLGLCSQAERERIESEYFQDEAAFEKMLTAEDDLIDAYARGELTNEERQRFEKHFLTSLHGRDRVQFARAFAGTASGAQPFAPRSHAAVLESFKTLGGWHGALRIVTITAVIVLVVVLSWLLIERRRMNNELRAEHAELGKQTATLRPGEDAERTRDSETTTTPADESRPRKFGRTDTQRTRHLPVAKLKNNPQEIGPEHREVIKREDATIDMISATRRIAQLPLGTSNVVGLLSLTPSISFSVPPRSRSTDKLIILTKSVTLIRLQLSLETAVQQHREYRAVIETADRRHITSLHWAEPIGPERTSIYTPAIPTVHLPASDYALFLTGRQPDGSFVRVGEYSFRVIRN